MLSALFDLRTVFEPVACDASLLDFLHCFPLPSAAFIAGILAVFTSLIASRATRTAAQRNAKATREAADQTAKATREAAQKSFEAARLSAEGALRVAQMNALEAEKDRALASADRRHKSLLKFRVDLIEFASPFQSTGFYARNIEKTQKLIELINVDKSIQKERDDIVSRVERMQTDLTKIRWQEIAVDHADSLDRRISDALDRFFFSFVQFRDIGIELPLTVKLQFKPDHEMDKNVMLQALDYANRCREGIIEEHEALLTAIALSVRQCQDLRDQAMQTTSLPHTEPPDRQEKTT